LLKAINSDPQFTMEVKRFDYSILGKTALRKLLMVKTELPEHGRIWNPQC